MPWYNIIFSRLVVWLMPIGLRKATHFAFLNSLIEPIKQVYQDFLIFREQQIYEEKINGQVIFLERVLNDTFDPILRRIYITDGEYFEPPVFLEEFKDLPVVFPSEGGISPIFWEETSLDNRVNFNFYVWVPIAVFVEIVRIKAVVNRYKVFGRTYDVKTI